MNTDYDAWAKLEAELSDAESEPDELAEKVNALREAQRSVNALRELRLAGDDEHLAEDAPPLGAQYRGTIKTTAPVLARAATPRSPADDEHKRKTDAAALVKSRPLDGKKWDKICDDHLSGENTPSKFSQLSTVSQSFDQMRTDRLARGARAGATMPVANSRLAGFHKLTVAERRAAVAEAASLSEGDVAALAREGELPLAVADRMIENVIGTYSLPVGVATNFVIDGRHYLIPFVLEEASVVAAASNMAKRCLKKGGFRGGAPQRPS
ncbi:hydroxymethylglutaryl-coenzyme A reductase [Aureococcus anophagefferens]|uniref:Hydroxymethylglutaryl-coenzyme A reductase n=1 Tax=Aureococcus anophagefferens TaxID=44056 RepID=A0ABR1FQD0_AURAN